MKVLVVGSGGREHALCWAIAKSPLCTTLYCAPGNAGIASVAQCVPLAVEDIAGLVRFSREQGVDFVVVGPEGPLVEGLVDRLEDAGITAFGPRANAAILEGSKGFMKDLCAKYAIPSSAYGRFREAAPAKAFVRQNGIPIVVKADGLAAGKGVIICQTYAEADAAIDAMLVEHRFGAAGAEVVVEEFLEGEEASFFALVDGISALPLAAAQDHKAVGDGDTGPNTGGMGAYSPPPAVTPDLEREIMDRIVHPTVAGMAAEGRPFKGVLFVGLMLTKAGPKVLEYNVRFGDPECQVIMTRLNSDILPVLIAAAEECLADVELHWKDEAALVVVMAANGYPGDYEKGSEIHNLAGADAVPCAMVFHAGTKQDGDKLVSVGGRVLGIAALAPTVAGAQDRAYEAVDKINWPGGFCRRDIGWRAIRRG